MDLPRNWRGATPAAADLAVELEAVMFDRVRALMVSNRLPATPPIYELLWRYLTEDDHALAHAVDLAIITQTLDAQRATTLHRTHCKEEC